MGYQFTEESKWIEDIKAGDKEAFKHAFDFFYSRLCAYTTNLTLDADAAEDIVQEIFIGLWNNRKRLFIATSLKSYLYKACYNKFIDLYRQKKNINKKLEEFRYVKLLQLAKEDDSIKNKKIAVLKMAVQKLPEKCREIFVLSKFDGLKYQEIADKLGISIKTVENQIGSAYAKLRKALNEQKNTFT